MKTWEFYRHMPVFLASGRLLGRTEEIGHAVDYIHVQQGHFLIHDWYIPVSAVRDVTSTGVYLTASMAEIQGKRWNVPSEEYLRSQGATPGYEYTSPADIPPQADAGGVEAVSET